MDDYKKDLNKIYRKTANLNGYVSNCNVKKERLLNELVVIKDSIEDLIKKLRK